MGLGTTEVFWVWFLISGYSRATLQLDIYSYICMNLFQHHVFALCLQPPIKKNNTFITPAQTDICFLAASAPLEGNKNKLTAGGRGGVVPHLGEVAKTPVTSQRASGNANLPSQTPASSEDGLCSCLEVV